MWRLGPHLEAGQVFFSALPCSPLFARGAAMLWVLPVVLLSAAPAAPPAAKPGSPLAASAEKFKVGALGLTVINQNEKLSEFYTEAIAHELSNHGLRVVTGKEISSIIGFEQQKQLVGCN